MERRAHRDTWDDTQASSEQRHADENMAIPGAVCNSLLEEAQQEKCRTHSFGLHSNQSVRHHRQGNPESVAFVRRQLVRNRSDDKKRRHRKK